MRDQLVRAVRLAGRQHGFFQRCPACDKPIRLDERVERYRGMAHHRSCVRYERKKRR